MQAVEVKRFLLIVETLFWACAGMFIYSIFEKKTAEGVVGDSPAQEGVRVPDHPSQPAILRPCAEARRPRALAPQALRNYDALAVRKGGESSVGAGARRRKH
jgi:hypothetical protein